jgi:hypothetical protein
MLNKIMFPGIHSEVCDKLILYRASMAWSSITLEYIHKTRVVCEYKPVYIQNCIYSQLYIFKTVRSIFLHSTSATVSHSRIYLNHPTAREFLICDSGPAHFWMKYHRKLGYNHRHIRPVLPQFVDTASIDKKSQFPISKLRFSFIEQCLDSKLTAHAIEVSTGSGQMYPAPH